MKNILMALLLSSIASTSLAQTHTISGYVKDASNGETLIGVTVLIKGTTQGVITNVYGFYSITLPDGNYELKYSYVGYTSQLKPIDLTSSLRIDVELKSESQQLEEIVITEDAADINVTGIQMSTNKLDIETITKIPAFMGEADVLKGIQMLPGVTTVGEGAAGFNVRGGSVGQNMVLLDEAPVYNSSHLMGFFSVFNPDAVKDVKLIKGGIPARYGGRISSVLDIRMKEGNNKKFETQGGVGTVFSRLAIEGPIVKDKASFVIAARRSYVDVFAKAFTDVLEDGAALNFYDLTAKTNWTINPKNRVFLSGYLGRDNFKFNKQEGINWGNKTATLRWNHIFSDRVFSNFTLFYSDYDYALTFGQDEDDQFDWNSRVQNFDFKPEFTYFINPQNELSFGGELLKLKFDPANASGVSSGEGIDFSLPNKQALEASLYISNDQKIGEHVSLQYGLRYSSFYLLGNGTLYEYGDAALGDRKPAIGETTYEKGEVMTNYYNFEPRFSVKYQIDPGNSIKASYNKTSQYLHLVSNTTASNPLDVWTPSSNNIKPQTGQQVALGWFRNFGVDNDVEFSAEVYYRYTKNQIDYIDGADLLVNELIEGDLLSGDGRAYGLELYAKKNTGKFTGWISYTLAKTALQVGGINNGNWYPTRYDQTHNFKLAAFYELTKRWSFSTNMTVLSGTPTTMPTSKYRVGDVVIPYNFGGGRNNVRIPAYHRLDISARLEGKQYKRNGDKRKNTSYWVFSIYNLYARKNPFSIYFTQDDIRTAPREVIHTQARQVSIVGSMIPAISYNFRF